jgi:hypothetical protein
MIKKHVNQFCSLDVYSFLKTIMQEEKKNELIQDLDELCRMITAFSRRLNGNKIGSERKASR